jgi:hypothetical protein
MRQFRRRSAGYDILDQVTTTIDAPFDEVADQFLGAVIAASADDRGWHASKHQAEGVNSFETDRAGQFRYEPVGHGAGGQRLRMADGPPGIKGPLRRLRPLTPERSSAREPLSLVPQPTFAAAGAAG